MKFSTAQIAPERTAEEGLLRLCEDGEHQVKVLVYVQIHTWLRSELQRAECARLSPETNQIAWLIGALHGGRRATMRVSISGRQHVTIRVTGFIAVIASEVGGDRA